MDNCFDEFEATLDLYNEAICYEANSQHLQKRSMPEVVATMGGWYHEAPATPPMQDSHSLASLPWPNATILVVPPIHSLVCVAK